MPKYHNKKVTAPDGASFDSKKEYERFKELQLLERAGVIRSLLRQVRFELLPAQYETYPRVGKNGKPMRDGVRCVERPITYVADFVYWKGGERIVEDVKSRATKTEAYKIKRKLARSIGIIIHEYE